MEELIKQLAAAVYGSSSVDGVKIINGRAIITLVNVTDIPEKTAELRRQVENLDGFHTVKGLGEALLAEYNAGA